MKTLVVLVGSAFLVGLAATGCDRSDYVTGPRATDVAPFAVLGEGVDPVLDGFDSVLQVACRRAFEGKIFHGPPRHPEAKNTLLFGCLVLQ